MNQRTTKAFQALFDAVKDNGELALLYATAQDAAESEIGSYAVRSQNVRETRTSLLSEPTFQRVLERAMAADPKNTELDLIEAGARTTAAELCDWWMAEQHRKRQAELARARGAGGGGVTDAGLTLGS